MAASMVAVASWLGSTGRLAVCKPAELMTTIAITVTQKISAVTQRLFSRNTITAPGSAVRRERRPPKRLRKLCKSGMLRRLPPA